MSYMDERFSHLILSWDLCTDRVNELELTSAMTNVNFSKCVPFKIKYSDMVDIM